MAYKIDLDSAAIHDLQKAIDYYDEQQPGLGKKFEITIDNHFSSLSKNPFFQVRYDAIHCLPVKKFPFMIHFAINEKNKTIQIIAVFHTSLDPNENWGKR
jgi:plasmid stabilization system protein ParE